MTWKRAEVRGRRSRRAVDVEAELFATKVGIELFPRRRRCSHDVRRDCGRCSLPEPLRTSATWLWTCKDMSGCGRGVRRCSSVRDAVSCKTRGDGRGNGTKAAEMELLTGVTFRRAVSPGMVALARSARGSTGEPVGQPPGPAQQQREPSQPRRCLSSLHATLPAGRATRHPQSRPASMVAR